MAARRLGNPCLCGIRINIPHAESSRQAIIRDSLLRRRKLQLRVLEDVKGKSQVRNFHSSALAHGSNSTRFAFRGYQDEDNDDDDPDEDFGALLDPLEPWIEPRRSADPMEPLFDFVPDQSTSSKAHQTTLGPSGSSHGSVPSLRRAQERRAASVHPKGVFSTASRSSSSRRFFDPDPLLASKDQPSEAGGSWGSVAGSGSAIHLDIDSRPSPTTPSVSYPSTSIESVIRARLAQEASKAREELMDPPPLPPGASGLPHPHHSTSHTQRSLEARSSIPSRTRRLRHGHFVREIVNDPVAFLRNLSSLPPGTVGMLDPTTYDLLFARLDAVQRSGVDLANAITPEDARRTIEWLCEPGALSADRMITKRKGPSEQYPSEFIVIRTSRGFRFKYFLQLSSWLHCEDLQRPLFDSLYLPHFAKGDQLDLPHLLQRPWPTAKLVEDLSLQLKVYKSWDTLIRLFADHQHPHVPIHFPIRYWTPKLLSKVMLAYHHIGNPAAIASLWEEYVMAERPLPTNSVVYHRLMTAHLKLGNMVEVRRYRRFAREAGFDTSMDAAWEAWNLLGAQRQFGMDPKLEQQILTTVDTFPLVQQDGDADDPGVKIEASTRAQCLAAGVIHGLLQLRLDAHDYINALRLLHRFDLPYLPPVEDGTSETFQTHITPTRKTLILAFEVYSRLRMDAVADQYWAMLVEDPTKKIKDAHIARYVQHLVRRSQAGTAFKRVKAVLSQNRPHPTTSYAFPPGRCEIGTKTMNALLFSQSEDRCIDGLVEVLEIMQDRRIPMDGNSIRWILRCLSRPSSGGSEDPIDLAATLSFLLRQADIPKSAARHLDSVMSRAIDEYNKAEALRSAPLADMDFEQPAFGLRPTESFRSTVKPLISDLTARWLTTESTSFAYRLEFEAMAGTQVGDMPSARYLWNQLIARGYKMSKRHLLGLIKGYTKVGKMDAAESVLELARQSDMTITRGIWLAMMRGYDRRPDRARNCYEAIRALEVDDPKQGLDQFATSQMINTYLLNGHHDQALDLIKRDLPDEGLDVVSLRIAGKAFLRADDPASAVELIQRHRFDQKLDAPLVETMISAYSALSEWLASRRASPREREACLIAETLLLRAQDEAEQEQAEKGKVNTPLRRLLGVLARSRVRGVTGQIRGRSEPADQEARSLNGNDEDSSHQSL